MSELIVILNKKGDILDFYPKVSNISDLLDKKPEEVYDDGELIRMRILTDINEEHKDSAVAVHTV
ncbi:hypothetical protein IC006_1219 [Sulfuracidifex tepidarius]|uniref:Uncharacterized protein n=1 Tax=Sulfuracidifex tepidarius TaxID=1294262 RepID=A0A510E2E9_9CREN|nr:hypothetical protein IC006_1219 [Sulfuracidifex tepidarius]BBG26676.1 hypothetical protein IC007_1194 [Sulfuracidifex tepidarius]